MDKSAKQVRTLLMGLIMMPVLADAAALFTPATPPIVGYVAQSNLSNYNLSSGKESVFRVWYERGNWSGNLDCYPINSNGSVATTTTTSTTGVTTTSPTPCWSSGTGTTLKVGAQSQVDLQGFASGSRNIATLNTTGAPVAFTVAADNTNLIDSNHANFIRGDRSQEAPAGALRTRSSALGDAIHSRPFYTLDSNGANPTVFYGGNDGMLHAIDGTQSTGGKERWAYIPSMLVPNLKTLWTTPYVHQDFVDGNVNIINIGGGTPQNILVGALGAGGKGLYALDVTSLTAASDADVVSKFWWEITPTSITTKSGGRVASTSYANLGYTYSNPTLAPVVVSGSTKQAVIVGNGYNNTGNGHATLFIIDVKTGTKIAEIDTGSGTTTSPNGLSTPVAVDSNGDGAADTVYAGDIDGNMWKFDLLTSNTPTSWTAKLLYSTKNNPATPSGQAITMMPAVSIHPYGGFMVDFATGRDLTNGQNPTGTPDDTSDSSTYYVYGIWDGAPATNSGVVSQMITTRQYTYAVGATSITARVIGAAPASAVVAPNWNPGGNIGWMVPLPLAGERVLGDSAFIQYGRFFFTTSNPTAPYTYTPPGGSSFSGKGVNWLMELDYLSGGNINKPFFDMDANGLLNDADRVQYVSTDTIPSPYVAGNPIPTNFGIPVGLMTSYGVQSQPTIGGVGNSYAMFLDTNWDVMPTSTTSSTTASTTGIGGGHFDVDAWYYGLYGAGNPPGTHTHEYDKVYDVNGVNLLNPNEADKALSNAQDLNTGTAITATTPYKVLMMNQSWNRSMYLTLGTKVWSTKDYQTGTANASGSYNTGVSMTGTSTGVGALKMSSLPTYTGITSKVGHMSNGSLVSTPGVDYTVAPSTAPTSIFGRITVNNVVVTGSIGCGGMLNGVAINSGCTTTSVTSGPRLNPATGVGVGGFEISMPNTAFQLMDWWGDGVVQTGVMPTFYACPGASNSNGSEPTNGTGNGKQYVGALGERNDGTLTLQVVKDTTPDACVKLNVPGRPDLGFRVIDAYTTACPDTSKGSSGSTPFTDYVLDEITLYWHHPNKVCYGDSSSTWATSNNTGDPWWPAQETGNNPTTTGTTFGTKADGSALICNNNPGTKSSPAWVSTTPPSTWMNPPTAWTTPPGWQPKGFTITPPLDTEQTLPLCPKYNALYDDPRTASLVVSSPGTGTTTTTTTTNTTTLSNLPIPSVGGMVITNSTCTGSSCSSTCTGSACQTTTPCTGSGCTPPCGTIGQPACNQAGKSATTGRISWHDLIHN